MIPRGSCTTCPTVAGQPSGWGQATLAATARTRLSLDSFSPSVCTCEMSGCGAAPEGLANPAAAVSRMTSPNSRAKVPPPNSRSRIIVTSDHYHALCVYNSSPSCMQRMFTLDLAQRGREGGRLLDYCQ